MKGESLNPGDGVRTVLDEVYFVTDKWILEKKPCEFAAKVEEHCRIGKRVYFRFKMELFLNFEKQKPPKKESGKSKRVEKAAFFMG